MSEIIEAKLLQRLERTIGDMELLKKDFAIANKELGERIYQLATLYESLAAEQERADKRQDRMRNTVAKLTESVNNINKIGQEARANINAAIKETSAQVGKIAGESAVKNCSSEADKFIANANVLVNNATSKLGGIVEEFKYKVANIQGTIDEEREISARWHFIWIGIAIIISLGSSWYATTLTARRMSERFEDTVIAAMRYIKKIYEEEYGLKTAGNKPDIIKQENNKTEKK